jgi:hypothetical protein
MDEIIQQLEDKIEELEKQIAQYRQAIYLIKGQAGVVLPKKKVRRGQYNRHVSDDELLEVVRPLISSVPVSSQVIAKEVRRKLNVKWKTPYATKRMLMLSKIPKHRISHVNIGSSTRPLYAFKEMERG